MFSDLWPKPSTVKQKLRKKVLNKTEDCQDKEVSVPASTTTVTAVAVSAAETAAQGPLKARFYIILNSVMSDNNDNTNSSHTNNNFDAMIGTTDNDSSKKSEKKDHKVQEHNMIIAPQVKNFLWGSPAPVQKLSSSKMRSW